MNWRSFIPPVVSEGVTALVRRSFASSVASWKRGDDMVDGRTVRLTDPYGQSPWVFAAINLVAGEFTGLPLKFYAGDTEHEDPALAAWWEAPALGNDGKRLSRSAVDQLLALYRQLHGEYFILLDDSWVVRAGRRAEGYTPFIVARPDRMRLVFQGAKLMGYVYTDPAGRQVPLVPEQVVHHMEPNPLDDWRGISRADVAKVATEGAFLTGVYIRDLMRNNGDQGFIVIGKSGVSDPTQREQIVADLRAKRAALRAGIAKDLFLTGEITVDRPKEQAAGVDLTNTNTLSHQEIFIAFGVPPSMSAVKQSYSIGKDSDRYQLITGTSQPLSRDITSAYADLATRQTGKALTAEHDWDDHPVLQEVRRARIDAGLKLWATGMAWKDVNDYLDLGMTPFTGWEIPYLPFSVVAVSPEGGTGPAADPSLAEGRAVKTLALAPEVAALQMALALRTRTTIKTVAPLPAVTVEQEVLKGFTCGCSTEGCVSQKAGRSAAEIARWREHMKQRRETVVSFKSAFTRVLMKARVEVLRKIEAPAGKAVTKATVTDLLFNLASFAADFTGAMRKQQTTALDRAGRQLMSELGKDDPFTFAPHEVLQFLTDRENKLSGVPQEIFDKVRATLTAGIDAGESTTQLTARVKREFNDISTRDAQRIAQTETAAAFGAGRQEAMVKAGVEYKAWLTSGNDNVREAHLQAGLDYPSDRGIPVDQPFVVGGEELMHPGDATGSPGNTINCHCVSIPVAAPDES